MSRGARSSTAFERAPAYELLAEYGLALQYSRVIASPSSPTERRPAPYRTSNPARACSPAFGREPFVLL